jgi:hypothetical protein
MNMAIKAAVVSCGVLSAVLAPLPAVAAQTNIFSGKDAFGSITAWSAEGNLYADGLFLRKLNKEQVE